MAEQPVACMLPGRGNLSKGGFLNFAAFCTLSYFLKRLRQGPRFSEFVAVKSTTAFKYRS